MKQHILFGLFLILIHGLNGQNDTLQLEEIIVSDNRMTLPFSDLAHSILIIDKVQIQNQPNQSIHELLQNMAGIDIRRRGVHGVQGDLSIRGSGFDQVLILINGVKFSDPQTGHHLLNIPIPIENIARIEVIKGPAARRYGQNAFAGAINIITAVEQEIQQLHLMAGEHSTGRLNASFSIHNSSAHHLFSFTKSFSEGYRYNSDYQIDQYFYQNEFGTGQSKIGLVAGFTERRFGANGFYASPDFKDQYEEIQTSIVSLESQHNLNSIIIKPRIYWRRNQDQYLFVRSNPSLYRNLHITHVYGAELNMSMESKLGISGFGIEIKNEFIQSNNLGRHQRTIASLFLEHRIETRSEQLMISPGFQLSHFSDYGLQIFPGIDIGYRLNEYWTLYGNYGYTYRVPTFTDLYYEDPANEGNPDLNPEFAITYEGGIKYIRRNTTASIAWFNRNGRNIIDWSKPGEMDRWRPSNLAQLNFRGLELQINYRLRRGLQWSMGYTYLQGENLLEDVFQSRYALENLKHQLTLSWSQTFWEKLSASVQLNYLDRISLADYTLMHLKLAYRHRGIQPYLLIENLLNKSYQETNLVPMPGRWLKAGVVIDLGFKKDVVDLD